MFLCYKLAAKSCCREHRKRTKLKLFVASKFNVPIGKSGGHCKWIMGIRTTGEGGILPGDLEVVWMERKEAFEKMIL